MSFIHPDKLPRTGNGVIDLWHRRLAVRVNEAYDLWKQHGSDAEVTAAMNAFFEEAGRHFVQEESIVRGAGYEDWRRHMVQHRSIKAQLDSLSDKLHSTDKVSTQIVDAFTYIDNLLYDHEFLEDQDFWKVFTQDVTLAPGAELLPWKDSYSVGNDELDAQHRDLVDRLNALHVMVSGGGGIDMDAVVKAVKGVRDHAATHFLREEKYMRDEGLDAEGSHRDTHEVLLDDLDRMVDDCAGCSDDLLRSIVMHYLRYWLIDHIVNADREIRKHNQG